MHRPQWKETVLYRISACPRTTTTTHWQLLLNCVCAATCCWPVCTLLLLRCCFYGAASTLLLLHCCVRASHHPPSPAVHHPAKIPLGGHHMATIEDEDLRHISQWQWRCLVLSRMDNGTPRTTSTIFTAAALIGLSRSLQIEGFNANGVGQCGVLRLIPE